MKYQFITENSKEYDVAEMCECFDLGRSGYYAWKGRSLSQRAEEDSAYKGRISGKASDPASKESVVTRSQ